MSIFNTPNLEAQQGFEDEASTGPQIGMLESFTRAMDFTRLIDNELGVKVALEDAENANFQRIPKQDRDKVERLYTTPIGMGIYQGGTLFGFTDARDVATAVGTRQRHDPSETALDDPAAYARLIGDRDKKLRELQARYPDAGIQTYDEMFRGTRERYDTMKFENAQRSFGKGSNIGWVAGSILAGVDPRTAPLSFASLPIGGVGKTIATRVATQGLGQGAVQAVEEVAGIRSNKRLLGEDPSLAESAANVAFATVGGGALQVVGEAAGGALKIARRRWFKDLPDDPAPPPPEIPKGLPSQAVETAARPLYLQDAPAINAEMEMNITRAVQETAGTSRAGQRVSHVDYAHTVLNMEDWGGPRPWEMQPPTASRIAQPGEYTPPNVPRLGGETIDQIARRIDPDTFKLYDKLAEQRRAITTDPFREGPDPFQGTKITEPVYHGGPTGIEAFKTERSHGRFGVYFSKNRNLAEGYAMATKETKLPTTIYEAQLNIKNPLVIKEPGWWARLRGQIQRKDKFGVGDRAFHKSGQLTAEDIAKYKSQGYDGIVNEVADEVVAFDAAQVRIMKAGDKATTFGATHPIDQKMRELAPVLSRAYARAEGKWKQHAAQRAQLDEMIAKGDAALPPVGPDTSKIVDAAEALTAKQVSDYVPELRGVVARIGEDAADTVKRVNAEESKNIDKALENVRAGLPKILELRGDEATFNVAGTDMKISLAEKIVIEGEDGFPREVTVRDIMKELDEDTHVLEAVTTCSLAKSTAIV